MAWKKSALKHSQTLSRARFEFMDMLLKTGIFALTSIRPFRRLAQGFANLPPGRKFFFGLLLCIAKKRDELVTQDTILDLIRDGLLAVILSSAPPLLTGLAVGLLVSIFQTVTSIQEPTLAFIPKITAVLLSLVLFGPFILTTLTTYFTKLISSIPQLLVPR
jgi:flagellar biosynthetic protein FliQ